MLGIIVLPLSAMVTCTETRAVIIALHKKIAPKSAIYRILKNFKENGSNYVKKAAGHPRKSSKCQDCLLKLMQLWDWRTTSTEHAQEWQQAGVSASARTVRPIILEEKKGSKEATSLLEKHQGQTDILQKDTGIGLLRTGVKSFSLMKPLSNCLGNPEKSLSGEDKVSSTISPVSYQQ